MAKTNTGLVTFCKAALNAKTGYVLSTFGRVFTQEIYNDKVKEFKNSEPTFAQDAKQWIGKRTVDCCGLVKYYMFADKYGENPAYTSKYDHDANTMFREATSKGDIDSIPEIPGLLLHAEEHVGVYIGNGQVIEAFGTREGVIQTDLKHNKERHKPWTNWFKCKWITYPNSPGTVVQIDTTMDVTKRHGETYIFKTTSPQTPTVTVGTSGVVTLTHLRREGQSDFWKLLFVGASGQSAGIYTAGPGEQPLKRFVARVA